jgi:type IV pilus assembly protein PilW
MTTIEHDNAQGGFSLIELMVALAITGVVLTGIYGAYHDQLRTSVTQQRIVDMNQNVRTAMLVIERDLRMAGANPTGDAVAGIDTATAATLVIAKDDGGADNQAGNSNAIDDGVDNDGDGIDDEGDDGLDNDGDGAIDEFDEAEWYDGDATDQEELVQFELDSGNIRRRFNSANSTDPTVNTRLIASNIDALNFVYLDGNDPPNVIATPVANEDLENIRSVQVTIVARSGANVPVLARKVTDNTVYRNPQGDVVLDMSAAPDQFRRRMVTTTIKCRNMGL